MYTVKPLGINIKQNDRDVADGFLQESINLQWRDGSYRPIPERLYSGISNTADKQEIILHKTSDEDKINVLMFDSSGDLFWYGTITDGVYVAKGIPVAISGFPTITDFESFSFTILNSLIYFMSSTQEFYYRLQFNEVDDAYEIKDMYAWKELIPFYPRDAIRGKYPLGSDTHVLQTRCGVILFRYTLVLKTGEEVLHSPIYATDIIAHNRSGSTISKDDLLTNIHTIINTNFEFDDLTLFDNEISAINIYATTPYYLNKVYETTSASAGIYTQDPIDTPEFIGEVQRLAETNFFLVKTLDSPSALETENALMFYVGDIDSDIEFQDFAETVDCEFSKIDITTIAAGAIMPIDNFSYHKLYGEITSNNGRLVINKPKTILSKGHTRAFATQNTASKTGFYIDTEDGKREAVAYAIDSSIQFNLSLYFTSGIISYPDSRAYNVGVSESSTASVALFKTRANKAHNLSCAFSMVSILFGGELPQNVGGTIKYLLGPRAIFAYRDPEITTPADPPLINPVFYTSENRLQFSESGEFTVWPAVNSYRVGEGKILFAGVNSVDPANADFIAPLIIGTSDGVYTVNFDATGVTFIQSITKAANVPAISSENIQIDQSLIYVSDKGLMAINNGQLTNLTRDYFPEKGNGGFPVTNNLLGYNISGNLAGVGNQKLTLPSYDLLTDGFNGTGNIYTLSDIIEYMKGALFAYDGRRNNIWCCNPAYVFSLVFNIETKQWDMSTYIFTNTIEFYGTINTDQDSVYSRFLVINEDGELDILSGEDSETEVEMHLLTRPIKMRSADVFKKIQRLISRCEIYKDSEDSYFGLGVWGKQDINFKKEQIPLVLFKDDSGDSFPNDVRQDIPVGRQKGKYKTLTILQNAKCLPISSFSGFDIVALPINNKTLR